MASIHLQWQGTDGASASAAALSGWTASHSTATYSTTRAITGTASGKTIKYVRNSKSVSVTGFYGVLYLYLTAAPNAEICVGWGKTAGSEFTFASISTGRALQLVNNTATNTLVYSAASSSYKATSSAGVVPTGEWVRIEYNLAGAGSTLKMWKASGAGIHSTGTPDVTVSTSGSGATFTEANIAALSFDGSTNPDIATGSNFVYTDAWGYDTDDWIGPATVVADFEQTTNAYPTTKNAAGLTVYPSATSTYFYNDTTRYVTGSKSGRIASGTTYAAFNPGIGLGTTNYFRAYYYLPAAPTDNMSILSVSGSTSSMVLGILSTRGLSAARGAYPDNYPSSGTNVYTGSSGQVPTGEWVRIEAAVSATSYHMKMWKASGAGIHSTGTPDVDTTATTVTSIGTLSSLVCGAWCSDGYGSFVTFTAGMNVDDVAFAHDGWIGPSGSSVVTHDAAAAASETASGAATATRTMPLAGVPSITASATAVAGNVLAALGAPSITAIGAADASVITTHNAEAASIITIASTDTISLTQSMVAASTITASAAAVGATNTSASGAVQAIADARAVVEGETSPGFLYATVRKNVLTN